MYTKHAIAVLTSIILESCGLISFCRVGGKPFSICDVIGGEPNSEVLSPRLAPEIVFEDQDRIIAYHGSSCAESNQPGEEKVLRVEEKLEIPPYAAEATVFLNGWRVNYLSSDHHVGAFATAISNIRLEGKTLKWQAAGLLEEAHFDEGYRWCYSYTAIAWNPANIKLAVDHKDGSCQPGDPVDPAQTNFFLTENVGTTTARSSFPTFLFNENFFSSKTVAIIPRGFGVGWAPGESCDHHLLQTAYNLDHSEIFGESGKRYKKGVNEDITPPIEDSNRGQVGRGVVSWETSAIFKDNDRRRDYVFGELVSGLGGDDVGVIQPPFSVLPHEGPSACIEPPTASLQTEDFVIDSIPFEYAIPMLTGWDLKYACDDEHVAEMGIGIDTWGYDKNTRTLRYTLSSILRDKNSRPGFLHRHKVTVLGIKRVAGAPPIP
jgi:hypothetical protein